MFGRKKKPKKKCIETHECLINDDIRRLIDKRAYMHNKCTAWMLIQEGDKQSGNDKIIARLFPIELICMNRKYETKLRKFAKEYKLFFFSTEYWESER